MSVKRKKDIESGSERIPRGLPRGKRANGEHYYSLWIEDSPQLAAESFKNRLFTCFESLKEETETIANREKFDACHKTGK